MIISDIVIIVIITPMRVTGILTHCDIFVSSSVWDLDDFYIVVCYSEIICTFFIGRNIDFDVSRHVWWMWDSHIYLVLR